MVLTVASTTLSATRMPQPKRSGVKPERRPFLFGSNSPDRVNLGSTHPTQMGNTGSMETIAIALRDGLFDIGALPGMQQARIAPPTTLPIETGHSWPTPLRQLANVSNAIIRALRYPFKRNNDIKLDNPTVDHTAFNAAEREWNEQIKPTVRHLNTLPLAHYFPMIMDRYVNFKINPDYIGIPPAVELPRYENAPPSKNTHGILAMLALSLLRDLPNGSSIEDTLGQLFACVSQINRHAIRKSVEFIGGIGLDPSGGVRASGPEIATLPRTMYSSLQTSHMVFITPNGALQIVARPDAKALGELFHHDPEALTFIEAHHTLNRSFKDRLDGLTDRTYDAGNTLALLDWLSKNPDKGRQTPNGWTDMHTLIQNVPLNFADHIANGRLKVLLNKPGHDGKTVWQSIPGTASSEP